MNRRELFAGSARLALINFSFYPAFSAQASGEASDQSINRRAVLVRSGFTRKPNGTDQRAPSPSGMFDTEVVRSSDSEGRLAVFVLPPGDHHPYRGAPLHVHHEQDEWIYVMTGEFVAEVGGERMRLKPGDSLLMPMKVPHRWSVAQDSHCGAIHLYTPAGQRPSFWNLLLSSSSPRRRSRPNANLEICIRWKTPSAYGLRSAIA